VDGYLFLAGLGVRVGGDAAISASCSMISSFWENGRRGKVRGKGVSPRIFVFDIAVFY